MDLGITCINFCLARGPDSGDDLQSRCEFAEADHRKDSAVQCLSGYWLEMCFAVSCQTCSEAFRKHLTALLGLCLCMLLGEDISIHTSDAHANQWCMS